MDDSTRRMTLRAREAGWHQRAGNDAQLLRAPRRVCHRGIAVAPCRATSGSDATPAAPSRPTASRLAGH